MYTPAEWAKKEAEYRAEQEKQKKLVASTVGFAQPGQMQTERDANQQGERSWPVNSDNHFGRMAAKWFSFDLAADPAHPLTLIVSYSNDNRGSAACDVLVDGVKVGDHTGAHRSPEQETRFFDVEYKLPADLLAGKKKVTVRFNAAGGHATPSVYGVRIVRADTER
jgi:hypothetical protein